MKIKTPKLRPSESTGSYKSRNDKLSLCGERTREVLGVGPFETFRLIISTEEMEDGFPGKFYNKHDDIYFKKKGCKKPIEFTVRTEDWILKKFPVLVLKKESVKVWVKLKSYSPQYAKRRE